MIGGLLAGICLFLGGLLVISLTNWAALGRLGSFPSSTSLPLVSVLLPARDEEANIQACLRSLLAQDYPRLEILVLDDESADRTAAILAACARTDSRLKVHTGSPPPAGWLGKNWACAQLADRAQGELLLFSDADTRHDPGTVRAAVAALQHEGADLLAGWPRLLAAGWGEKLLVPLISWSVFAILPIPLAHRLRSPALSAAIGQFLLIRRQAYDAIGGHAAVREHAAEDLALCRLVKRAGFRWRLVDAQQYVHTHMYASLRQAWNGLSKNLYPAFDYRSVPLLLAWSWLALVAWAPIVMLGYLFAGGELGQAAGVLSSLAWVLSLLLWGTILRRTGYPTGLTLLHPLLLMSGFLAALNSVRLTRSGRAVWKDRRLAWPGHAPGRAPPAESPR